MNTLSFFDSVLSLLNQGKSFTMIPFVIIDHDPDGRDVHTFKSINPGEIGYLLQWWARQGIYNPDLRMSFRQTPDGIVVNYKTKQHEDSLSRPETALQRMD